VAVEDHLRQRQNINGLFFRRATSCFLALHRRLRGQAEGPGAGCGGSVAESSENSARDNAQTPAPALCCRADVSSASHDLCPQWRLVTESPRG